MKEQISALLDGEGSDLERAQTMRAIDSEPELRATWERYHIVSAAIRRELDIMVSPEMADRLRVRLHEETPQSSRARFLSPRVFKLTAGLAIAASVAAVAILNLPPLVSTVNSPIARNGSTSLAGNRIVADTHQTPAEQRSALNPYLVQHGEYTPAAGMNGMLSYVRVIGRDSASTDNANAE